MRWRVFEGCAARLRIGDALLRAYRENKGIEIMYRYDLHIAGYDIDVCDWWTFRSIVKKFHEI